MKALNHLNLNYFNHHTNALKESEAKRFYTSYFEVLNSDCDFIFDRGHLGEYVYSDLYRDYNGDYVFDLEDKLTKEDIKLVLLTTSKFDLLEDDGFVS